MRIEQLEYLAAVTRHGSLRRASEHLHLSQPALSESVTKLERELKVTLLDRQRSGARISTQGRELLPFMEDVLAAVARLRAAAVDQGADGRVVRVGTVHAGTATILVPAVRAFETARPAASVEVLTLSRARIDEGLAEGTLHLGLVNVRDGEADPGGLASTDLLHGRPVAVLPAGHRLTGQAQVTADDLRTERLLDDELGKAAVAEGLGVSVLPDYSVVGDPLHRAGLITTRPIAGDTTLLTLVVRRRTGPPASLQARELHAALVARARECRAAQAS